LFQSTTRNLQLAYVSVAKIPRNMHRVNFI
jgi:hypothetical protein